MKILSKILVTFAFTGIMAGAAAGVKAENASEPEGFTGDIYRISSENLDESLAALERIGGKVLFNRDDLYLIIYPEGAEFPEAIAGSRDLRSKSGKRIKGFGPLRRPKIRPVPAMVNAGFLFDANYIREGVGLPNAYDGEGVVVGMTDVGFDATHPNFLNADGTESRIKKFVHYNISTGERFAAETTSDIPYYPTDTSEETHATHVAGIMAGRGGGGKYIGMAPGADIVATTSDLYEVGMLAGIEEIIGYAKSVGKPAVVNISISNYTGPHDGTSLFCQYLDKCGDDAIICISSGNEAAHGSNWAAKEANHIGYTFKSDDDKIVFGLVDTGWAYKNITADECIYSEDDSPVSVGAYIRDTKTSGRPIVFETPMINLAETPEWVLTSDPEKEAADPRYHYDETFASMFTGEVYFTGGIDPENGRFRAEMYYRADTDIEVSSTQQWGRFMFGGYVSGKAGKYVDVYADGVYSRFRAATWPINPVPDHNMTISDLATGYKVIPVGAYWVQESLPINNGAWAGGTPMSVCQFSSYGTLRDGRVTPMTVAPGGPIASSYSSFFINENGNGNCCYAHEGYEWGANSGTSMASPYVAGAIATWLQADPTLTIEEVQDLIVKSNNTEDYPLSANPRHGQGFFDPYKGMQLLIEKQLTNVGTIPSKTVFAEWRGESLRINNPANLDLSVTVIGIDGRELSRVPAGKESLIELSASDLNISGMNGIGICRISVPGMQDEVLKIMF